MTATWINTAAVLAGGMIGLLCKNKIPQKIADNVLRAIGLCVCVIGVSGALKGDLILLVLSLALGTLTGEMLRIDNGLNRLGVWLQKKLNPKDEGSAFAEGFVTATLLFCVGAMSVVGSLQSGLNADRQIILTKSALDCISAMLLASTLGVGVLFSAGVLLVYQGSIELFAGTLQNVLHPELITQVSAVGSVMILAIGLNMVLGAKIKTANLLPGLVFAVGFYVLFWRIGLLA